MDLLSTALSALLHWLQLEPATHQVAEDADAVVHVLEYVHDH
jgi:hypothetical protein